MAHLDTKDQSYNVTPLDEKVGVAQTKTITGSEAFTEALVKDPPRPFAPRSLFLYFACLIGESSKHTCTLEIGTNPAEPRRRFLLLHRKRL